MNNFLVDYNCEGGISKKYEIEYIFQNNTNKEFKLNASVFDFFLARQWCFTLAHQTKNSPNLLRNGLFHGNIFQSLDEVSKKISITSQKAEKILKKFFEFNL